MMCPAASSNINKITGLQISEFDRKFVITKLKRLNVKFGGALRFLLINFRNSVRNNENGLSSIGQILQFKVKTAIKNALIWHKHNNRMFFLKRKT